MRRKQKRPLLLAVKVGRLLACRLRSRISSTLPVSGQRVAHGSLPRTGVLPLAWSLDHVGPMARTARDCVLILKCIAGHDPSDATTSMLPVPDYVRAQQARALVRREIDEALTRHDLLLTPTTPTPATLLGQNEIQLPSVACSSWVAMKPRCFASPTHTSAPRTGTPGIQRWPRRSVAYRHHGVRWDARSRLVIG